MNQYELWLLKAKNDLSSSKKLLEGNEPILDTAIYHTQQCAEKALKGYLAYQQKLLQKTHDLELLLELCAEIIPEFSELFEDVEKLNPYSTAFRYPDLVLEPEKQDVLEAIQSAEKVLSFVMGKVI